MSKIKPRYCCFGILPRVLGLGEEVFSTADALCNTCNNEVLTSAMLPGF